MKMTSKLFVFMAFCTIFLEHRIAFAQSFECDYRDRRYSVDYFNINITSYTCDVSIKILNYCKNPTRIIRQHKNGRSDADVKYLYIGHGNFLRHFSPIFCKKFPNLEVIRTDNAQTESIDGSALNNCLNLKYLSFESNKFLELPEELLSRNSKLARIWIRNNNQLKSLPEKFFINQKKLLHLHIRENHLDFLPSSLFDSLMMIQRLDISDNKLQSIDPKWFTNLRNLKVLGLFGNQITEVPAETFKPLRNLEVLWLNNNKIKVLSPAAFEGLKNLQELWLNGNEILELPKNIFAALRSLKKLGLENNKLTTIHSDSFGSINKLTSLWLKNNRISSVDPMLIDSQTFEYFDMQNNTCSDIYSQSNAEIKPKLQQCFQNYKPRPQTVPRTSNELKTLIATISSSIDSSCGKPATAHSAIIGGIQAMRGAFPWLASMVNFKQEFLCGGSIISNRKVLTAAHCLRDKGETVTRSADEFLIVFGHNNLDLKYEVGRSVHSVQSVHIHPDWDSKIDAFDADLAVLIIEQIQFGEYIQPICLAELGSSEATISNGLVIGYGRSEDESKKHENIAKVLNMPIHDNEGCFLKDNELAPFSSRRTFCGGSGDGTGICMGDSGSPFMVLYDGAYYLRGIVSNSLIKDNFDCDVDTYSIFTNVLKFYDWINEVGGNPNLYKRKK